jgi:hypothetical protein
MTYISRDHVRQALTAMKGFHSEIQALHRKHGLPMLDNTGRRNVLMSAAQEGCFAKALSRTYKDVICDGKTGEPDIVIGELGKELECKITTPSSTSGGVSLQTDYATLKRKGSLDYLYVIADKRFEKFVVLHYTGLTTDDFAVPCSSSRGKSSMMKHVADPKCNILWGAVRSKNEWQLGKLQVKLANCSDRAVKKRERILASIKYWTETPTRFTYKFEEA